MNRSTTTRFYTFHGLGLAVSCSEEEVLGAVHSRLRQFHTVNHFDPDLKFDYRIVTKKGHHAVRRPAECLRPIYNPPVGEVVYSDDSDQIYIDYADGIKVISDAKHGKTRISVLTPEVVNLYALSHPMFTLPFIEQLKRHGYYNVHAAGLSVNGRGLLFPGTSGSGKSTLALTLLRAGFDFLGDDMMFLHESQNSLKVLAFPDEIDVTDNTAAFFLNYDLF